MIWLADVSRVFCVVFGIVGIGLMVSLSKTVLTGQRFTSTRRYARWSVYLFAVTAIGGEAERWGEPPTYKTVFNVVAVFLQCTFVVGSIRLTSDDKVSP